MDLADLDRLWAIPAEHSHRALDVCLWHWLRMAGRTHGE